ncbi:MAG TPA: cytochrome c peroxidase [Polyangiaceae bacterium]|nr:cytochrome c peroxidase [Polyangiaceae bacterium]
MFPIGDLRGAWCAVLGALSAALAVAACEGPPPAAVTTEPDPFETVTDQPIEPLPLEVEVDAPRAALGELLFHEPLLSGDGKLACSDCHKAEHGLADDVALSRAAGRPESPVNSPTMYNVRFWSKLAWGGRFDSLESHNDALMTNPNVMASSWSGSAERLAKKDGYAERFGAVFKDGLTGDNVRAALVEYERSLVTPNAAFDRYLRGEHDAISPEAKHGYALFKSYGCASCHQGKGVGGNMLQRVGVMRDYFADRGDVKTPDFGRFNVTKLERDRFVFRVPSLRNVALTAPYFHDGSAATLENAVTVMARYQLGRELEAGDVALLVAFLRSLTGEYRGKAP